LCLLFLPHKSAKVFADVHTFLAASRRLLVQSSMNSRGRIRSGLSLCSRFGESTDVSCIASKRPAFWSNRLSEPQRCEHGVKPFELMISAFRKCETSTFPKSPQLNGLLRSSRRTLAQSHVRTPSFPLDLSGLAKGWRGNQSLARLCVTGSIGRLSGVVNEILCGEFVTDWSSPPSSVLTSLRLSAKPENNSGEETYERCTQGNIE